jgi:hypothetical protein
LAAVHVNVEGTNTETVIVKVPPGLMPVMFAMQRFNNVESRVPFGVDAGQATLFPLGNVCTPNVAPEETGILSVRMKELI